MASEVFAFGWPVPLHGYAWYDGRRDTTDAGTLLVPGGGPEGRFLSDARTGAVQPRYRLYDPIKEQPALFRTFADLRPTEESIAAFANRYGHLGEARLVYLWQSEDRSSGIGTTGEHVDVWVQNIGWMRQAIDLWDLIRTGNRAGLAKFIRWRAATPQRVGGVSYDSHADKEGVPEWPDFRTSALIAGPEFHPEWIERFAEGDTLGPAQLYLARHVNQHLREKVSPRLLIDLRTGEVVLRLVPHSLLGCLWLQLAEAISARKEQRQCLGCKQWFEVKARGTRSDKQFCSGACRNRVYRTRIETALRLRAEGKKPREIAEVLDADLETVKTWLKKGR